MSKIYVVGSFITDLTIRTSRLPVPGETVIGDSFEVYPGGKGFNQAVAARRAGCETVIIGALGDDEFAGSFKEILTSEQIDASRVGTFPDIGTGVGVPIVERTSENFIVIVPRANDQVSPAMVEQALTDISSQDILLLQLEVPLDANIAAASVARRAGARVILNPAPYQPLPTELMHNIDVLVPNEVELLALVNDPQISIDRALEQARELLPQAHIVVTLGSIGARILEVGQADSVAVAANPVKAIDTVGAGDVFCGNLAAGLASNFSLSDAVNRANTAAAISVTRTGSASAAPHRDEVDGYLSK